MIRSTRYRTAFAVLAALLLGGCAASGGAPSTSARYGNFLVIGVAGSYDARAQFERSVVSGLRAEGVAARPYHLVVGGNRQPVREDVVEAVKEHGFDAVLVTRVLDADSEVELRSTVTGAKVTRKDDGFLNLFRYDYEALGDPVDLTVNMHVDFVTELHSVATRGLDWSAETRGAEADNVAVLVDDAAKTVVRQLKRAGKLAR